MYKIAWIHKQHYYIHCLPAQLPLFFLSFPPPASPPPPQSLSHTQTCGRSIFSRATLAGIFRRRLFSWKWLIREPVEKLRVMCSVGEHSKILQRGELCLTDSDMQRMCFFFVSFFFFWLPFFFNTRFILAAYLCCSVILSKLSHLSKKQQRY